MTQSLNRHMMVVMLITAMSILVPVQGLAQARLKMPPGLSNAVFLETGKTFQRLTQKLKTTGDLSAADLASFASSARILIEHLQETGATDAIQKYLLENSEAFIDTPDPQGHLTRYDRVAFIEKIRSEGLHAFHENLVAALEAAAQTAMLTKPRTNYKTVGIYGNVCLAGSGGLYYGAGSLYLSILALTLTGPVGWGIGAFGAVLGALSLICS